VSLDRLRDSGLLAAKQLEGVARLPEARDADPRALGLEPYRRGDRSTSVTTALIPVRAEEDTGNRSGAAARRTKARDFWAKTQVR